MQFAAIGFGPSDGLLVALASVVVVVGFLWAAIPAAVAGVAGLAGKIVDAASSDSPNPYWVDKGAYAYAAEPERYRSQAQETRGMANPYQNTRNRQLEPRAEQLAGIRGYDSQAGDLQRMAMEQARQQQMAAAGRYAGTSQGAAALRGAGYATAQAQDAIARSARERLLAEMMAKQQALGAVRQGDIGASALDIQDLQARIQRENLARLYEAMGQQDRQFSANLQARGEDTQAAAATGAMNAQQAAAARESAERQGMWGSLMNAGAMGLAYAGMQPSTPPTTLPANSANAYYGGSGPGSPNFNPNFTV